MDRRLLFSAFLASVLLGAGGVNALESKVSPEKVAAQRRQILADMLTDKYDAGVIAGLRRVCATGRAPASVAEDRAEGSYFTPDPADQCVTALLRTAQDRRLPELYAKLLAELGGNPDGAEKLPGIIGAAVVNGDGKVAIGNGKVALVKPALAFDAGSPSAIRKAPPPRRTTPIRASLIACGSLSWPKPGRGGVLLGGICLWRTGGGSSRRSALAVAARQFKP